MNGVVPHSHHAAAVRHVVEERRAENEQLSQAWNGSGNGTSKTRYADDGRVDGGGNYGYGDERDYNQAQADQQHQYQHQDELQYQQELHNQSVQHRHNPYQHSDDEQDHNGYADDRRGADRNVETHGHDDGESDDDDDDDDLVDKISSSPSIDDGGCKQRQAWPARSSSLTPVTCMRVGRALSLDTASRLDEPDSSSSPFTSPPAHYPLFLADRPFRSSSLAESPCPRPRSERVLSVAPPFTRPESVESSPIKSSPPASPPCSPCVEPRIVELSACTDESVVTLSALNLESADSSRTELLVKPSGNSLESLKSPSLHSPESPDKSSHSSESLDPSKPSPESFVNPSKHSPESVVEPSAHQTESSVMPEALKSFASSSSDSSSSDSSSCTKAGRKPMLSENHHPEGEYLRAANRLQSLADLGGQGVDHGLGAMF